MKTLLFNLVIATALFAGGVIEAPPNTSVGYHQVLGDSVITVTWLDGSQTTYYVSGAHSETETKLTFTGRKEDVTAHPKEHTIILANIRSFSVQE